MPPPLLGEFEDDFQDELHNDDGVQHDDGQDAQSDAGSDAPPPSEAEEPNGGVEDEDEEGANEDDEDDDGEGEDEFVVESIFTHTIDKGGELRFHVKWEGYDDPNDMTWEPIANLEEAPDVLNEYLRKVGGRAAVMAKVQEKQAQIAEKRKRVSAAAKAAGQKRKRGRPSLVGDSSTSGTPSMSKKARKQHPGDKTPPRDSADGKFVPPSGSWEEHIANIDIIRDDDGRLIVYLTWKDGWKTRHETSQVYRRCPQQMLRFYERHVKIIVGGAENDDSPA